MATTAEVMAVGRLQGIVLSVVQHGAALRSLAAAVRMDDAGWRIAAHVALRSIRAAADQRDGLPPLPGLTEAEGAAILTALSDVAATATMADLAVVSGNVSSFTALVAYRLPRVLAALDRAMQTLTRTMMVRRETGAVGFAC